MKGGERMQVRIFLSTVVAGVREFFRFVRLRTGLYKKRRVDVLASSDFGKALAALSACRQFSAYVEIGTAHGLGSTKCIMDALLARPDDCHLWSVESVRFMHAVAVRNWRSVDTHERLTLVRGTVAPAAEMMTWDEARADPAFSDFYTYSDYRRKVKTQSDTPDANPYLPKDIDVLLLDGGEFTSYAEYKRLAARAKVIFLDDAQTAIKNRRVRQEMLASGEWKTIIDVAGERNGWGVYCRPEFNNLLTDMLSAYTGLR